VEFKIIKHKEAKNKMVLARNWEKSEGNEKMLIKV
jgi:hypothetical protein